MLPFGLAYQHAAGDGAVSRKTILLSKSVRQRIEDGRPQFLARASLRAMTSANATRLLDAALAESPDLIVLSDDLAGMSIGDLLAKLRARETTRDIPVLVIARPGNGAARLREESGVRVLESGVSPEILQEAIATGLGVHLRRYPRFPVVLPIERGRIFREFLGYSNSMSEGGMGFETLASIRTDEMLPLRIYRNSEEKPIAAAGRVRGVRPNVVSGIGFVVGVEFYRMSRSDRDRLIELFPADPCIVWSPDRPADVPPDDPRAG